MEMCCARTRGLNSLNWTVFNAATSQPKDCKTKTAILLPTYLRVVFQ